MSLFTREEALEYHSMGRKGKLEVLPVKPCANQKHLSMAYSPGVAEACLEIADNPAKVFDYTNRANLVAVISNGTAVLGLGDIGPMAGKPVMEGKGVLFKAFADIDVYDININQKDPEKIIEFVKMLEPTFGGINLEDIKAPECFKIEETLIEEMDIPVFHDDQHGTAIISGAGLLNALEITGKKIEDMKMVVSGAGAASIACCKFYVSLGLPAENIFMYDSRGLLHKDRKDLNKYKLEFAQSKDFGAMTETIKGADVFIGLSVKGLLSKDMVKTMAKSPIIFAMANPDPEISYPDAKEVSPDCIMGTGRSDYPNQVNNVSGFPFIFRGALDVNARKINEEMKIAAASALADLAKEPVPQDMLDAYGLKELSFGPDYVIPKPLDSRIIEWESTAVAEAAMTSGVARSKVDLSEYRQSLKVRMEQSRIRIKDFISSYNLNL
ncbi:malic enzyme-like NAD(P)-binding protein [Desulfonatronovibrio magnus]|uniref:malic enzyme-like NAD(P)-binding protein n=1 Tax=Desulfonatronovibrio magnus TaxID=698827 RepID=UPI0005EB5EF7|nr:malic enzyme-like NAD(P)-binding protein [Desulfonatronovibrio magnus]RQD65493.1 MAG: malate dehydrogenase [Desulfonatronovibrio sp. MSAO_Bac4]